MTYHAAIEKVLRRDGWTLTSRPRGPDGIVAHVWEKPGRYPVTVPIRTERSDYREGIVQAYHVIGDTREFPRRSDR